MPPPGKRTGPRRSKQRPVAVHKGNQQRPVSISEADRQRSIFVPKANLQRPVSISKADRQRSIFVPKANLQRPVTVQQESRHPPVSIQDENPHPHPQRPISDSKAGWQQPVPVYLGLGGNVGDSRSYLRRAIALLADHPAIKVKRVSPFLETEPVGYLEQANFLNGVVQITTFLTPQELLAVTQSIENELGRMRTIRWGPRTIDIDILLYGDLILESTDLTIPHPRMLERAFVLQPLAMIAPELRIPGCKATVRALAQKLQR